MPAIPPTTNAPVYDPLVDRQKWTTEHGFIDNFSNPDPGAVKGLGYGLAGAGLGASAGAMTGHNPWISGVNTGAGSALGYLLANALSRNSVNKDTYSSLGGLAGGALGLGGTLMSPAEKEKKQLKLKLPGNLQLAAKTAGVSDVLNSIHGQLPSIGLPESLAGGALGAGGGWLYDKLNPSKDKKSHKLNRMLAGAGIGALGANVGMDRFRRYVSNNLPHERYDQLLTDNPLKPKGLKHIWDSAIMDKPQQPGVGDYLAGNYHPKGVDADAVSTEAARRELERRDFNVHTSNPKTDIWKKQPDNTYSVNPGFGDSSHLINHLMYPDKKLDPYFTHEFLRDPMSVIGAINNGPDESGATGYRTSRLPGYMSGITGGQRIATYPFANEDNPNVSGYNDYVAKMQDQWNVGLRPYERHGLLDYFKDKILGRKPTLTDHYNTEHTPDEIAKSFLQRSLYDNVLSKTHPWVSQRLALKKLPIDSNQPDINTGYASIPTTASGEMYPGKTIGTYNQPRGDIDYRPASFLETLSKGGWKPQIQQSGPPGN